MSLPTVKLKKIRGNTKRGLFKGEYNGLEILVWGNTTTGFNLRVSDVKRSKPVLATGYRAGYLPANREARRVADMYLSMYDLGGIPKKEKK